MAARSAADLNLPKYCAISYLYDIHPYITLTACCIISTTASPLLTMETDTPAEIVYDAIMSLTVTLEDAFRTLEGQLKELDRSLMAIASSIEDAH